MNSTENATFSVLPDSTSPEPGNIISIAVVYVPVGVVVLMLMVKVVCSVFCKRIRTYTTYGPESVRLNDCHTGEENTNVLVGRTSARSVLLTCSTTQDVQIETTDFGNTVVTEDQLPANYVQNEPQYSESRLGPYGKDSEHKVVMPLLPKVTSVPDKSERCYNNDTHEPVLAANDVYFIDEERTEQCLSECEISSTNIGSDNHIADNQEELIFDIAECKISTVTHLKSPVGNTDETLPKTLVKPEEQNVETNLDWNRVFRFLVNHLDARKWMLFFNTLYGNTYNRGSLNVDAKLKQVEHDTKQRVGGDTVTLLMEQFKAWKEFSGRNAKLAVIYQTLREDGMNDTLENFETYMRKLYFAKRISQYKEMLQDYRINEKHLMTEFDHILRYAEEHNLNDYEFSTCHKLIDCGERDKCKHFNFTLRMHNTRMLTTDMFLSWKNIPSVDNIMIALGEHRNASGVIEMKCFTSSRALYDAMRQLLPDSDTCFVICPPVSMNDYQKLISSCVKL